MGNETGEVTAPAASFDTDDVLQLLRSGDLEIQGRLVDASNATFCCCCH